MNPLAAALPRPGSDRRSWPVRAAPAVLVSLLGATPALGAPPDAPPQAVPAAPAPSVDGDAASKKEQARVHFEKGLDLFADEAWDAAAAEFLASRALYPTRPATKNAAICLRKLARFDEALDLFELALQFPGVPEDDRAGIERAIDALRGLVGTITVEGAEPGATVTIDGRVRGTTPTEAPHRVRAGAHVVRVHKVGFVPVEVQVDVAGGQSVPVQARLAPLVQMSRPGVVALRSDERGRFFVEASGAFGAAPSFGGDLAAGCAGACSASPGLGFAAWGGGGYRFLSGFTLGVEAGYLFARQRVIGRPTALEPAGLPPNPGDANDTLTLHGALLGAAAGFRLGARFPVTLRVGGGAFVGSLTDRRTGTFETSTSHLGTPDLTQSPSVLSVYLAPEARAGLVLGGRVELSIGLRALVLFTPAPPAWDPRASHYDTPTDGRAYFPAESLSDRVLLVVAPGLAARCEL